MAMAQPSTETPAFRFADGAPRPTVANGANVAAGGTAVGACNAGVLSNLKHMAPCGKMRAA
eukprot:CAMPEP_0170439998 /NCGR_PEP_ID=MMETSP0117_2-20130122/46090_1 /TAXON_ID=400756 /ORGANISM="Durinskia baltica, Strain CSIRO CS-38" /LENGTH=60 /DNA_ID=CAMNT_0010700371 /DNA_START=19 /DNA_END=197 /DNA_ORIENTATION=+